MATVIDHGLVSLDAPLGADSAAVIRALAENVVAAGRATDADAPLRRRVGARGEGRHRRARRHRHPARQVRRRSPCRRSPRPACPRASTSAPSTAPPTSSSSSRCRGGDAGPPHGALDARPVAHPRGLHRVAARGARRRRVRRARRRGARAERRRRCRAAAPRQRRSHRGRDAARPRPVPRGIRHGRKPVLIAVTACPTGIAHTYMAADALVEGRRAAGVELHVETQGSAGATPLAPSVIAERRRGRLRGRRRRARPVAVRRQARRPGPGQARHRPPRRDDPRGRRRDRRPVRRPRAGDAAGASARPPRANEHFGQKVKRVLLTGVSYMIPFVAGGGLLIALGFLLRRVRHHARRRREIVTRTRCWNLPDGGILDYLGAVSSRSAPSRWASWSRRSPGYIAYAIADRPGIAPGFVAGSVAGS